MTRRKASATLARPPAFGSDTHDRLAEAQRQIKAMDRELRHLEHETDRYSAALRDIAADPDSGSYGEIAIAALRPKRAPPA